MGVGSNSPFLEPSVRSEVTSIAQVLSMCPGKACLCQWLIVSQNPGELGLIGYGYGALATACSVAVA